MLKKTTVLVPALMSFLLSGCGIQHYLQNRDANLVEESYDATDRLHKKILHKIPKNSLIVVSTLLNVDNLNQTSSFGRIVSDQIASAFNGLGYQVIGMEMPIDLFVMKEGGRFHLSDETKAMLRHYHAATLLGGVYAPGKHNGYVSLRMVDINSKNIIASTDFAIPMGPDAKMLMKPKSVGSADLHPSNPGSAPVDNIAPLIEDNNQPLNQNYVPRSEEIPEPDAKDMNQDIK
ncbi:FlgO family outer membrane protein [Crenothrix sp.]|uniref:FlgO family outer membrane protein n=1 Tax=Crenothrix sp. TaxID=3100433 RepID=UPI00374C91B4